MTNDIPPTPPPPPPADATATPFPWEDRTRIGVGRGFLESVRDLLAAPTAAFARMRERGDYASPLLFALIVSILGVVISQFWMLVLGPSSFFLPIPGDMREEIFAGAALGTAGVALQLVIGPILALLGLLIGTAIVHLFLLLFGGLKESPSGFEGSFRTLGYSSVSQLAGVVPFVGWLLALIWGVILQVIGLARLHRTTPGRALAAVVAPLLLCCVCIVLFAATVIGLIAGAAASGR